MSIARIRKALAALGDEVEVPNELAALAVKE